MLQVQRQACVRSLTLGSRIPAGGICGLGPSPSASASKSGGPTNRLRGSQYIGGGISALCYHKAGVTLARRELPCAHHMRSMQVTCLALCRWASVLGCCVTWQNAALVGQMLIRCACRPCCIVLHEPLNRVVLRGCAAVVLSHT